MTALEFRVPISPIPGFYASVRLIAVSLARLGPPYSSARLLVSVGDYADLSRVKAENEWAAAYPIEWRIVSHELFETQSYMATGADRYCEPARADTVVLCDADTCPVARFDELLSRMAGARAKVMAGLQAHFSPFGGSASSNEGKWRELLAGAGFTNQPLVWRYSMDPEGLMGSAPPYFNYGMVAFNRPAFDRIAPIASQYVEIALKLLDQPFFAAQVGLTFALLAAEIDPLFLGHAYNCANDDLVWTTGLTSTKDIKIIHYLREDEFARLSFLADPAERAKFLGTPKRNLVSERLRDHIASLAGCLGIER